MMARVSRETETPRSAARREWPVAVGLQADRTQPVRASQHARAMRVRFSVWPMCYRLPLCYRLPRGEPSTEEPVDLCITQARYTQLHRHIKYSQE
jgi:hypothetical protein